MDQLFTELIGKPTLNPPKIITIVAENFSLLEDQARFLKAALAIPSVKQLPLDNLSKRLIQIGPIQYEIEDQVRKAKWAVNQYEDFGESICDRIAEDLREVRNRSLIFVNDISRFELSSFNPSEPKKLLALADSLKRTSGHFIVIFYQNTQPPNSASKLLRDLEYMSDAVVKVHTCKAGYFQAIWWQTIPTTNHTLIPSKIETGYYTSKIGKFYWSSDLLCFYERNQVKKNYDLETDTCIDDSDQATNNQATLSHLLEETNLYDKDNEQEVKDSTLPYTQAQNPEQSRIFYYPDKDDDIDEDDPDNDLGI